jgi:predicted DNA-binding transcriptional regulator YafY
MERHILFRIHDIDRMLKRKEYPNCTKLKTFFLKHHGLNLSIRTLMRDIDTMRLDLGAPIEYDREKNGYYYTDEKFSLPSVRLTAGELISIFLAEEILKKYKNTPFEATIKRAFEKVELLLPQSVSIDFNEIGQTYSFDIRQTRPLDKHAAKVFDTLAKAIGNKTSVEINYYTISRNATRQRVIDPYHLRHTQGAWYVIGYCHLRKDVRTFAVNQIREIKKLKEIFAVRADFSPEKFFEHSWGISEGGRLTKVVVKLDKAIARWFEDRKLHSSQQTKENNDGSLTLTFKVAGTNEIKRWILSQGRYAKVTEPESLRREIKEEAAAIAHG